MRTALLEAGRTPLSLVDDVETVEPGPGQVLVRVHHCGLCHSDLTMIDTDSTAMLPIVLGHEASGIVEEVGLGVRSVKPGDHVVSVAMPGCGRCYFCLRNQHTICPEARTGLAGLLPDGSAALHRNGQIVYRGLGVGGFSQYSLTTENGVAKIDDDIPLDLAAVVGCAVQTGVGAVLNLAKVEEGATVLVMGLGGIGISVVQGARIAGAARINVSDPIAARRDAALHFGATDAIDPNETDVIGACYALTNGIGVDYAFDAAGHHKLVEAGLFATRYGGTTVMVGAPAGDQTISISPAALLLVTEKRLMGTLYGTGNPAKSIPTLLALWRRGALDLESMVSYRRPLDEINEGFDDLRAGRGIRTMLTM